MDTTWHEMTTEPAGDGSGTYVTRRPGVWHHSSEAHEAVTLDFDADGNLIGVEIAASPDPSKLPNSTPLKLRVGT